MNLEVKGVERFGTYKGNDIAFMSMGLDADLRGAFSWNTKTVFLYVEAEWETPLNKRNQVLLWDRIIESREEGVLSLPHLRNHMDSPLADQGTHLLGRDINFTVSWNVIPHIGKLYTGHKSFTPFTMPKEYVRQYE